MNMQNFSIILAVDEKNWLWKNNDLAWKLKADMKYFREITTQTQQENKQNAVIMWRKTWESIPEKFRPLPWRQNFVLTRDKNYSDNWCVVWNNLDEILEEISNNTEIENIFIIWGSQIYNQVLEDERLENIYLTRLEWDFWCDVFLDPIPVDFLLKKQSPDFFEDDIHFSFQIYKREEK